MNRNQIILILITVTSYLTWSYFDYESSRKHRKAFLSDLNISIVDMTKYLTTNLIKTDTNYTFWNLEKSDILSKREKELSTITQKKLTKKDNKEEFSLKKRVICLNKKCWEFLGVVEINNRPEVTLLSKNKKLQIFHLNDMLLKDIKIIKIKGDELVVEDTKKKKEFTLKLFEVDVTKYLPKENKKEKNDSKI